MTAVITADELASRIGATVAGDGSVVLSGINSLDAAGEGQVGYIAEKKHAKAAAQSNAAAFIASDPEHAPEGRPVLVHAAPQFAFAKALRCFHPLPEATGQRHPSAAISGSASIAESVDIGAHVSIGEEVSIARGVVIGPNCTIGRGVSIGEHTRLAAGVHLLEGVSVGAHTTIHSGTVIGADGFGFVFHEGFHHKIPQVGTVEVGDHCEIGSNTCIDRATLGVTRIGNNVIIDNLVQIGHNCVLGDGCIIVSQTGISGSTTLGKFVTLAGQSGVSDHLEIGDGAIAATRAGINRNIKPGEVVFGYPPVDPMSHKRQMAALQRLPELLKEVRRLEKRIAALEAEPEDGSS